MKYKITIEQYNRFDIEADNAEEAKRIAIEERRWDETDPHFDLNIEVKEMEAK